MATSENDDYPPAIKFDPLKHGMDNSTLIDGSLIKLNTLW